MAGEQSSEESYGSSNFGPEGHIIGVWADKGWHHEVFLSSVSGGGRYEICRREIYSPCKMIFLVILRKVSQRGKD